MSVEHNARKAAMFADTLPQKASNAPSQYGSKQAQYLSSATRLFDSQRAKYSSDYVIGDVQGLDADDFYKWQGAYLRLSDVVKTSTKTPYSDDYKQIMLPDYEYIALGAKIVTMGSTWLVINPSSVSSVKCSAVVARCNASYNSFDKYGNVVTEPIFIEKLAMQGNNNSIYENTVLMDGYFAITAQLNDNTRQLGQNKRIILGTKAYYITGFQDFLQEFTGDRGSAHLVRFTGRIEEPVATDDMTNYIADGNTHNFAATISPIGNISVGTSVNLTAVFADNGNPIQPATWLWESSNASICTVANGTLVGVGAGTATVTATLAQNADIKATASVVVEQAQTSQFVAFKGAQEGTIKQYSTATYEAAYFENGAETAQVLTWTVVAPSKACKYTVAQNGKSISVTCLKPSENLIQITATYQTYTKTINVKLEGY